MLFDYLKTTQRRIRDARQEMIEPGDLITYINQARREIAERTQCVRVLTPISGAIISATVTSGGSGYSSLASVSVNAPDFPSGLLPFPSGAQASISCVVQNGSIASAQVAYGGSGYFQPQATVVDSTGTGASITLGISSINTLNQGQEVYPFSGIDLAPFPGVDSIFAVKSVSVIYANYRYSLPCYSFSVYQAMIRQYPFQYQYVPTFCSQYGQGASGSLYTYPYPSQTYQMEWDCFCLPSDLATDEDPEVIPQPWQDAVPYFAAHLAYLELQNLNSARLFLDLFDRQVGRYSAAARPGRVTNPYGRFIFGFLSLGLSALLSGLGIC